jgi:hypothetical protein
MTPQDTIVLLDTRLFVSISLINSDGRKIIPMVLVKKARNISKPDAME